MAKLLERLEYSRKDCQRSVALRHSIPIDGDRYTGTATLRQAAELYRHFCMFQLSEPQSVESPRSYLKRPRVRKEGTANWPNWPQPTEQETLALAKVVTRYVRFLHPDIIAAVVTNNELYRTDWSAKLTALDIDATSYLWPGSACTFPGIRRYAGAAEIKEFRSGNRPRPKQALDIDDNDYPKHIWSFVCRRPSGRAFLFVPTEFLLHVHCLVITMLRHW